MRRTSSGSGSVQVTAVQSISTVSLGSRVTFAPIFSRISRRMCTSEISGTFSILQGPLTSRVAGMMATAAFFAPLMVTVPTRGRPPSI